MKNSLLALSLAVLMGASSAAFAAESLSENDLKIATEAALAEFKSAVDAAVYESVSGYEVSADGEDAEVSVFYKQDGVEKTASFHCHYHGAEMACHMEDEGH